MDLPPLPDTTILLVEVGSTAHGTGIAAGRTTTNSASSSRCPTRCSDDDRGFRTVMQRTQPEGARSGSGDVDRTLHSLRRFVRHAASGNPSILMALWAPIDHATAEGKELQALGEAFMRRHVIPRYRGYMQSQAQRLLGTRGGAHGRRGGGGREELVEAHGYDTKYAMHCARLGFQCQELLTTGQLELPVQGEPAEWVRAVRRGDIGFDEWWSAVLRVDEELAALQLDERFSQGPDQARIERWTITTHQRIWRQLAGSESA